MESPVMAQSCIIDNCGLRFYLEFTLVAFALTSEVLKWDRLQLWAFPAFEVNDRTERCTIEQSTSDVPTVFREMLLYIEAENGETVAFSVRSRIKVCVERGN
jgi:nucleoid DNA-binding protein